MAVSPKIIRNKRPFNDFDENIIEELAKTAVIQSYTRGETIFAIGEHDNKEAFLILGAVELISRDNKKSSIKPADRKAEYAICHMKPRQYTAVAASHDTCICWIHSKILEHIIEKYDLKTEKGINAEIIDYTPSSESLAEPAYA